MKNSSNLVRVLDISAGLAVGTAAVGGTAPVVGTAASSGSPQSSEPPRRPERPSRRECRSRRDHRSRRERRTPGGRRPHHWVYPIPREAGVDPALAIETIELCPRQCLALVRAASAVTETETPHGEPSMQRNS